jgi:hypothetical protein
LRGLEASASLLPPKALLAVFEPALPLIRAESPMISRRKLARPATTAEGCAALSAVRDHQPLSVAFELAARHSADERSGSRVEERAAARRPGARRPRVDLDVVEALQDNSGDGFTDRTLDCAVAEAAVTSRQILRVLVRF